MENIICFEDRLSILSVGNLHYCPGMGVDDNNKIVKLASFCSEIGVDRSSFIEAIHRNRWDEKGLAYKDALGHWNVRLKVATKFIEKYRFGILNTRNGKAWSRKEVEALYCNDNNKIVSERINKSPGAVKMMRVRLRLCDFKKQRKWKYPFFITPHAMLEYKKRILNIPDQYLIWNINKAFDSIEKIKNIEISNHNGVSYRYKNEDCKYLNFRCVVIINIEKDWPIVVTVFADKDN